MKLCTVITSIILWRNLLFFAMFGKLLNYFFLFCGGESDVITVMCSLMGQTQFQLACVVTIYKYVINIIDCEHVFH